MTWRRGMGAGLVAWIVAATIIPAGAQNGSQFRDWTPSALADSAVIKPRAACATLVSLTGYEFSISTAPPAAASIDSPEYCHILGLIQPEIRFEVSLPAAWNGRLYMFGNGGYAGEALDSSGRVATVRRALARGFAVAQTNTGHDAAVEALGTFASSPQKFLDYAYRSVHVTGLTAKTILERYYAGAQQHSYFDGCSTGGRQGLISARRFPEDLDGIVAGAPVLNFSGTMISYAAIQRALEEAPLDSAKVKVLGNAVYAKCDAVDGLRDGVIDDPRRCAFSPASDLPLCPNDVDGAACFTAGQIRALDTIYGSVKRNNAEFFPGWPVGAEVGATGQVELRQAAGSRSSSRRGAASRSASISATRTSRTSRSADRTPPTIGCRSNSTPISTKCRRRAPSSTRPIRTSRSSAPAAGNSWATSGGPTAHSTR